MCSKGVVAGGKGATMRKGAQVSKKRALALLFGSMMVLASCTNLPATTMYTYGDHANRILNDVMMPVFWMAVAVFVIVQGALVYTVIRFRSKKPDAPIPVQTHGNTNVEIAWTIAPAIVVLIVTVLSFRVQAANSYQPPEAIKIFAVAHQWWFEFQYDVSNEECNPFSGAKSSEDALVTASDLYIPVGQSVQIQLEAADVMHNFWVPKLAGKTYMIPGKTNYLAFKAEEPGIYRAFCAEFCGEAHAQMRFRVIALAPDEYAAWKTSYKKDPVISSGQINVLGLIGDVNRGEALFAEPKKQCISCHIISGTAAKGKIGPNLTHYGSRLTIAAGVLPYSTDNLALWMQNPEAVKQGNLMGRVIKQGTLTDQEVADLTAYLDSMKLPVTKPAEK
jgi:cytochrome c oxidase subunit 2